MKGIEFLKEFQQLLAKYDAFIYAEPTATGADISEYRVLIGDERLVVKGSFLTDLVIQQKIGGAK